MESINNTTPSTPSTGSLPPAVPYSVPGLAPVVNKATQADNFDGMSNAAGSAASTSPAPTPPGSQSRTRSPSPAAATSRSTNAAGTKNAEAPKASASAAKGTVLAPANKSTLESLLDACKDAIMAAFNLALQIFALVKGMATNSAVQFGSKVAQAAGKVADVARANVESLRGTAKAGLNKMRGYTNPSLKPAEGRYEQSKFWVKNKLNTGCNWLLNKIS